MTMPELPSSFTLNADPWDFHSRSRRDILRHNQKVTEAIKGNLPEIISHEDIITSDGKKIVKVPIRGVELPHFRFDPYRGEHIGQGDQVTRGKSQNTQPGTVIGGGGETGKRAGHEPGADIYETEMTVEELVDMVFKELGLPNLESKGKGQLTQTDFQYDTIRKTGPQANLDRRRTLVEAFKRHASLGEHSWEIDPTLDSRYKSWEEVQKPIRNAVVIAMRDVSGSMGDFEAYICRSFYTWMVKFLRKCYTGVEVAFVTCHTEAQEVDEDKFFHLSGSGGTRMSSAYSLALDIIGQRYNPNVWNIYPFLFSDGDNWDKSDNSKCITLVQKLLEVSNLVGYGETQNYGYWSDRTMPKGGERWAPLGEAYNEAFVDNSKFVMIQLASKEDVWPALQKFLGPRHEEVRVA